MWRWLRCCPDLATLLWTAHSPAGIDVLTVTARTLTSVGTWGRMAHLRGRTTRLRCPRRDESEAGRVTRARHGVLAYADVSPRMRLSMLCRVSPGHHKDRNVRLACQHGLCYHAPCHCILGERQRSVARVWCSGHDAPRALDTRPQYSSDCAAALGMGRADCGALHLPATVSRSCIHRGSPAVTDTCGRGTQTRHQAVWNTGLQARVDCAAARSVAMLPPDK